MSLAVRRHFERRIGHPSKRQVCWLTVGLVSEAAQLSEDVLASLSALSEVARPYLRALSQVRCYMANAQAATNVFCEPESSSIGPREPLDSGGRSGAPAHRHHTRLRKRLRDSAGTSTSPEEGPAAIRLVRGGHHLLLVKGMP